MKMSDKTNKSHTNSNKQSWKRMSFKGNKVWAALTANGDFLEKNNKILIKYNLKQDYEYWINKDNLKPEAEAMHKKKTKKEQHKTKKNKNSEEAHDISENDNTIIIYTDGASSGNPGPAGIGAVLVFGKHKKEISEFIGIATNNIAELTAIEKALQTLKTYNLPVRLFTDSSYCHGLLSKGWKPKANIELVNRIKKMIEKFQDFKIIKVKGHEGIELNERADKLATSAIKNK